MKIVYLIQSTFNSGGMERVLCNKVNWLVAHGHNIHIITTDQKGRDPFFDFASVVTHTDLGLNYEDNNGRAFIPKVFSYIGKQRRHRRKLNELLAVLKANIVISMYGTETTFLPKIKDGSAKLFEIHFSRYFRSNLEQATQRNVIYKLVAYYRQRSELCAIEHYNSFVVLTYEDRLQWLKSSLKQSIKVIPNSIPKGLNAKSDYTERKRVLAVGRLDVIKGFDLLIKAWSMVATRFPDWSLDIYGMGELQNKLEAQIARANLQGKINIMTPTDKINEVYEKADMYVLSSRCEGLPMVLLEAMACGVPAVAFACKCGPRDVITNNVSGLLIEQDNIEQLATGICQLIENPELRQNMGQEAARSVREKFNEDKIMCRWDDLFNELSNKISTQGQ